MPRHNTMLLNPVPSLSYEPESEHPALVGMGERIWYGGPENRFAYYVAKGILESTDGRWSDRALPPALVLYGPHGSGKSTLLQMLHEGLRRRMPSHDVQFPPLEEWARSSSAQQSRSGFRLNSPLAASGILLLDDLHQLADRPAAQRALIARLDLPTPHSRLIVTCLDAPWSTRLEPRLVSRLSAGLTVRMSPPGAEVRRAYLQDSQQRLGVAFSPEATRWLTYNYRGSFTDLTQLVRTCLQRHLPQGPIPLSDVKQYAGNDGALSPHAPKRILAAVCREFGVSQRDLLGHSRRRTIVTARAVAIHALRQFTDWSLEAIGAFIGKRDHSTVLNALRRVHALAEQDPLLRSRIENVVHRSIGECDATYPRSNRGRGKSEIEFVDNVADTVANCQDPDTLSRSS